MYSLNIPQLDRFITLYLCAPLNRLVGQDRDGCVPILSYHSISNNLFGHSHPYHQINTHPEIFSQQMRWLKSEGYQTVHLTEMLEGLASGLDLSKRVVLTFEDGYRDFLTDGFGLLKQCGFSATVFLATDRIHEAPLRFEGVDYLTWSDVRELHREGIQFGSHTVTHPDLRSMEPEQIDYELGYSKEVIEQKLGSAVDSFSYPFAFPEEDRNFKRFLADTMENNGYNSGITSIIGRVHEQNNPFFLPRLAMNSWDTPDMLRAKLTGSYDWMHIPQWFFKFVTHNMTIMQTTGKQPSSTI